MGDDGARVPRPLGGEDAVNDIGSDPPESCPGCHEDHGADPCPRTEPLASIAVSFSRHLDGGGDGTLAYDVHRIADALESIESIQRKLERDDPLHMPGLYGDRTPSLQYIGNRLNEIVTLFNAMPGELRDIFAEAGGRADAGAMADESDRPGERAARGPRKRAHLPETSVPSPEEAARAL